MPRLGSSALMEGHRGYRHSHEWRQIQLDNGTEMSAWLHFDRDRAIA